MTTDKRNNDLILVIDDNRAIHADFRKILCGNLTDQTALEEKEAVLFGDKPHAERFRRLDIKSAYQGQEGLALVQQAVQENRPYAMAFVDVRMPPGWDGIETAVKLWEVAPDLQVVICTAYSDYPWEDMSERLGRSDRWVILKKPFDPVEVLQLVEALTEKVRLMHESRAREEDLERRVQERTADLAMANEALRATQFAMDKASDAIFWLRPDASCAYVNDAACRLTGIERQELLTKTAHDLNVCLSQDRWTAYWAELKQRQSLFVESGFSLKDGRSVPVEIISNYIEFAGKEYACLFIRDISERKRMEQQLRAQQKLEAVGVLAGGVAHDFNNILTSVRGYTELLMDHLKNDKVATDDLKIILREVDRVVALTGQLLAFSQRQLLRFSVTGLNQLIAKMENPLHSLLGSRIEIKMSLTADLDQVKVDQVQIMKMMTELVDNAREAMPQGGCVKIKTENINVTNAEAATSPDGRTGEFVRLSFSDSGAGMTPEAMQHLFDPFFSTKQLGAGLGLPSVYGLVKQHKGWIAVASAPGSGTTFHIYLPRYVPAPETQATAATIADQKGHAELVLFVEDEENVRILAKRVLQARGYQVLTAESYVTAKALFEQKQGAVDLLFSDILLGDQNGIDLAIELQARKPALKVLLTTGYSDEQARWPILRKYDFQVIHKPFSTLELFQTVRGVLEKPKSQAPLKKT